MNLTFRHMAIVVILLYLFLPVMGFAHSDLQDGTVRISAASGVMSADIPCEGCPCSDGHGSDCCDASSCNCSFHTPPLQSMQVPYAPDVELISTSEPFWFLPQVYLAIFVPPQNLSVGVFRRFIAEAETAHVLVQASPSPENSAYRF